MPDFDVVVVGGGLIGMAAALSMSKMSYKVLLLDASPQKTDFNSNKTLVLNHASVNFLEYLGVQVADLNDHDIQKCIVSARGHLGRVRMDAESVNLDFLGKSISYSCLFTGLQDKILTQNNLTVKHSAYVNELKISNRVQCKVGFEASGEQYHTSSNLVLAADGFNSKCRDLVGLATHMEDIDYKCLVARVCMKSYPDHVAMQRFLAPGSLATIPISDNSASLIWTLPSSIVEIRESLSQKSLISIARSELGNSASYFKEIIGQPESYSPKLQYAEKCSVPGLVLLGSAAINLLPITAQGLNIGLRDIIALENILLESKTISWDEYNATQYNKIRKQDHLFCYRQVKYLQKIFSHTNPPLNFIRSFAMSSLSILPMFTGTLATKGAGYSP
ncbi:MAG: FAD-dependent monooxygenase [Pseudomonadota bacterium]|nr:FAD-dependent monooxygenase [Pseudomonadota bacterium]